MGKTTALNRNFKHLKFSVRQMAKKRKVSKTAMHNAILKYQNEGIFIERKGLADQGLPPTEKIALCVSQLYSFSNEYLRKNPG